MASIPGSHFTASAPGQMVNVVETTNGQLPPPAHGVFNLEVWTGNPADAPNHPAHGFQGLAVLEDGGRLIDLISGAYAVTDNGTGNDTIGADGTDETISGGTANVTLNLVGNNDVANGGGQDTISVFGDSDTVNAAGNDLISVFGKHDVVNGGTGRDTISVFADHDTVNAGVGNEQILVLGSNDRITGGTGNDTVDIFGNNDDFAGGTGNTTVLVFGSNDSVGSGTGNAAVDVLGDGNTVTGGIGNDTINVLGNNDLVAPGAGISTVFIAGKNDTVDAGNRTAISVAQVTVGGTNFRFNDGPDQYLDTIVGFSQGAGDRIHLTTESVHDALANSKQVNHGQDTLITLKDGSTILLKGISHIDQGFFN